MVEPNMGTITESGAFSESRRPSSQLKSWTMASVPKTTWSAGTVSSVFSQEIVLQKLPHQRFPGKIRLLGVASLNLVSVGMGQTISALEATPKIWDLAAAWLVLQELNCPVRWLVRDPAQLQAGEDLSQANFPVLAARDAETLARFKPWADALVSST